MRRRDFIKVLGSGAVAWPLSVRAQQPGKMKRVGVLLNFAEDNLEEQALNSAFVQAFQQLGWIGGRNVQIDTRWTGGDAARARKYAAELVALEPDAVLAVGTTVLGSLLQATRRVPIVFVQVTDPVGGGFVDTLARPGGNATGFITFEYSMSGKWLELLKEIAPNVMHVAVLRNSSISSGIGQFGAIQSVAPSLGVELRPIDVRDVGKMESDVAAFAGGSNGGLIATSSGLTTLHRELIITLAARYKLPAVYAFRFFVTAGGLMSYSPDIINQYRRAASYVDRILKGEKPADLPVQAPTSFKLVINLKTAKTLGLTVPPSLLARADEVIE
jgi:putative ABC transport system substrate-binding protein